MGTIYKRGNVFWVKYYQHGKPIFESSRSKKEADAKKLLQLREGEIVQGKVPGVVYDRVRFEDLAEMFLRDRRINGKGVLEGERRLKHLEKFFFGVKVPNIDSDMFSRYIDKRLDEGAANATINRERSALCFMLTLGYRSNKVSRIPYLPKLEENNVKTGFLEDFEYETLREALPEYLRGVLDFGYLTGWRKEEVVGLTWDRVDLQNRKVRLNPEHTKNKQVRDMFMEDALLAVMYDQWANKTGQYVFHRDGYRIKDFRGAWSKACRDAGIGYGYKRDDKYAEKHMANGLNPGPTYHDLRRTAVREMSRAGVPRKIAMMRTGHKTESVYSRYNIVNEADLELAAKRLDQHRNKGQAEMPDMTMEQLLVFMMMVNSQTVTKPLQSAKSGGSVRRTGSGQVVDFTGAGGRNRTDTNARFTGF